MHKRRVNELQLTIAIEPDGPLLIKSGVEAGADPTLPTMNFVRTRHPYSQGETTIYLPGSSLKGVIRSHSERILRTALGETRAVCCNPLDNSTHCSTFIRENKINDTAAQYRALCLACRMFGHMVHASHFHPADAYPIKPIDTLPLRQNVAIDRLSGGVAVGPFDMEVALNGQFVTTFSLFNFELWQLGLLALALRDLDEGLMQLGFAKSRGLGKVRVHYLMLSVGYPGRFLTDDSQFTSRLYGVSALAPDLVSAYDYVDYEDLVDLETPGEVDEEGSAWGRPGMRIGSVPSLDQPPEGYIAQTDEQVRQVLRQAASAWARFARARKDAMG